MGAMRDLFSLADRVALVTGASQGLGAHMARVLAASGAHVVLCARNREKLAEQAEAIRDAGGRALDLPLDITEEAAVVGAVARVVSQCGGLDILVNNAGIVVRGAAIDSDTEAFRRVLDTNLTGAYRMAREAARPMLERGWGRIINIGSILSLAARATVLAYTTSKHAVTGLTRGLAAEFGSRGVNVNALLPGYFRTEINVVLQQDPDFSRWVEAGTPLARWGEARDLDGPLLFLASDASRYVNGHLLVVDGGMTATL
jgi:NAD(P)-dependent dehydrogenase (short-subunit alcohol dehydrogenase family)